MEVYQSLNIAREDLCLTAITVSAPRICYFNALEVAIMFLGRQVMLN